jgi:hypothetical protein
VQAVAKPRWTSASYLVYAGAFVVLVSAIASVSYLASQYGSGGLAGWALLIFAVLLAVAHALRRQGHALAAGVFAFVAVDAFGILVGSLWTWWGWLDGSSGTSLTIGTGGSVVETSSSSTPFSGFDLGLLSLELLILLAAIAAVRAFRHPLPIWTATVVGWLFVADVISNGGNWTAVVTLFIGLVYQAIGRSLDGGPRDAYGFWFHLSAGLLIGGTLLFWWHAGDFRWSLICVGALVYIAFAHRRRRSSWAVLGSVGLAAAAAHFSAEWSHTSIDFFGDDSGVARPWAPIVVFAVLGFLLVALGLARRDASAAS